MRRKAVSILFLSWISIVAVATQSRAQEEEAPAEEEAQGPTERSEAEEPQEEEPRPALRVSHISAEATRTRATVHQARLLARPNPDVGELERELPQLTITLERQLRTGNVSRLSQLSRRELVDARQEWRRYADRIEEAQAAMMERADALESTRAELDHCKDTWESEQRSPSYAELPPALEERVRTSLSSVEVADEEVRRELDRVLTLTDRLSDLGITVADTVEQIQSAAGAYRDRLFLRDRPPLWESVGGPLRESEPRMQDEILGATEAFVESFGAIESSDVREGAVLLALGLILALLLSLAARRARGDATRSELGGALDRPLALAALISLISVPIVIRTAPVVVYDSAAILLLLPLARVLPPLLPRDRRPLAYFLLAMVFLGHFENVLEEGSRVRRIAILLEAFVTITGLLAYVRWRSGKSLPANSLIGGAIGVAVFLAAAGIVANLLGYGFLAMNLVRGLTGSVETILTLGALYLAATHLFAGAIESKLASRLPSVRLAGAAMKARVDRALRIGFSLLLAVGILMSFSLAQPLFKWLEDSLEHQWTVGSTSFSLGHILLFVAILVAAIVFSRMVHFFLETDVLPPLRLEAGIDGAISMLTRYLILAGGLLLALAAVGIEASQIAIVAGALGVGVGFGLQGIVANCVAGVVLMLERPVRLGDFIQVGTLIGRVERIGLRSSTVRAGDGAEVIVPNDGLIGREVVNWTLTDRKRRAKIDIRVAYGTDPRRVIAVLTKVASANRDVLGGPAPDVSFVGFGESSLNFSLGFWAAEFGDAGRLQSEVGIAVYDALKEEGIEIPFPQQDVHLVGGTPRPNEENTPNRDV